MPAQRELFRRAHRSQVVLAGFDDDATGSAQRARAADVHEANSILHRGAEQCAAAARVDLSPVEFDRHDVGPRSHSLEPGSEGFPDSVIIHCARGFDGGFQSRRKIGLASFSIHFHSFMLRRSAFRARASRDSTACSPSRNIRAISVTPISSTYFRSNTSRCSGLRSAKARLNSRSARGSVEVDWSAMGAERIKRARRALVRMRDRTLRCAIAQAKVNNELSPRKNGRASASAMKVSWSTSSASAAEEASEFAMKRRMRAE